MRRVDIVGRDNTFLVDDDTTPGTAMSRQSPVHQHTCVAQPEHTTWLEAVQLEVPAETVLRQVKARDGRVRQGTPPPHPLPYSQATLAHARVDPVVRFPTGTGTRPRGRGQR